MAWRSSGVSNDEMVDNMKRFGVIHSAAVENAFRSVDRRFFVPQTRQDMAHADQPLKEGNVHISAPHIYGSVVEALDVTPSSSLSFLNIGSGTGYLSSIVAEIIGPTGSCYGVEIHGDVVDHCRQATQDWKNNRSPLSPAVPYMEYIHGNGLLIDATKGESVVGFDRIYIGASVEKKHLQQLVQLLRPRGILVGPVDDELVKVMRIGRSNTKVVTPCRPTSSRRGIRSLSSSSSSGLPSEFSLQVLSGVRFAPLLPAPSMVTVLPSRVWEPSIHGSYPESFRKSCKEILLCARAPQIQPPRVRPNQHINAASTLPRALWMEILSFTHRDWFEQPRSEEDFLRQRLVEEQAISQRAQEARMEAEARLHMIEHERDVYRLLAMRWQSRLQSLLNERNRSAGNSTSRREATTSTSARNDAEDDPLVGVEDISQHVASVVSSNEPLILSLGGLSAMIRRFQTDTDDDDDDEEEDDEGEDEEEGHGISGVHTTMSGGGDMEAEADMDEDGTSPMDETNSNGTADHHEPDAMMVLSPEPTTTLSVRQQARTVSVTSDDL